LCEGKKLSNIYLPFNKDSDLDNFKVFIQQLSNSDERIKRSCKEKNIGGYVNIETAVKEDESEEKKEEDEEKYSKIEYRYDMVYDSVEIKEKLSGEEKVKALIEFYEKNQRLPRTKEKYKYNEIEFSLYSFWDSIRKRYHIKLYEERLSKIKIFKEEYEKYQSTKFLTPLERVKALVEFYDNNKRLPKAKEKYAYKGIKIKNGHFWNDIKQGRNKHLYELYLSKIDIFREEYERFKNLKEEKKSNLKLTAEEKIKGLVDFYENYHILPKQLDVYKYKGINIKIGRMLDCIKQGYHKDLYEQYLSKIDIFREEYERFKNLKEEKKSNLKLTAEEKIKGLVDFYENYHILPKQLEVYKYEDVKYKIGKFWSSIKEGGHKELYNKYLSKISIFKEEYERVQKLKEEKKLKKN
jgi:hypothetical protein